MQGNIISGDELMVFVKDGQIYKSIAYATSHKLSVSVSTLDISSRQHDVFGSTEAYEAEWQITTENLYTEESYSTLHKYLVDMTPLYLVFGMPDNYTNEGTDDEWIQSSANGYKGIARLTSLQASASSGDVATLSATFLGISSLKKVDETPDTEPTLPTRAPAAIWFDDDEITKAFEATHVYQLPVMNNSSGLPIRYVVGPNVSGRIVEDNGEQYLITSDTGTVEVTALFDGNDDLESTSTSVIVHIGEDQSSDDWTPEEVTPEEDDTGAKINPVLRFEREEVVIEQNEDYNIYDIEDLYNPYNLPVTYSCSNAVINIDQTNLLLEIDDVGDYTIVASFAGNAIYNAATATYLLRLIQKKDEPDQEQVVWNIDTSTQNVSTYFDETYTATIRPISITPSEFANGVKVYVNGTLLDSNSFVLDTAGTYTIRYVFEGNEYYDPSSTQYSIVYTQEARPKENVVWSIDTSSISVSTYNDETYTGTYKTISISPAALASDVKVYLDNTLLNSNTFTLSTEGTYTIRYVFEGNDYYNPSSTQYSIVYTQTQRQQYVTWGIDTSSISVSSYVDETYTGTYRTISITPSSLASEVKVYLNNTLLNSNSFTLSSEGTYTIRYVFEGNASYYPSSTQYNIVYTQVKRNVVWNIDNSTEYVETYTWEDDPYTGTYREISISPASLASEVKVYLDDVLLSSNNISLNAKGIYEIKYVFEGNNIYNPSTFTYQIDYDIIDPLEDYFTIILQDKMVGSISINFASTKEPNYYYSLDRGNTWTLKTTSTIRASEVGDARRIKIKHSYINYSSTNTTSLVRISTNQLNAGIKVAGNLLSLIRGDGFNNLWDYEGDSEIIVQTNAMTEPCSFKQMFCSDSGISTAWIVDAYNLFIPITRGASICERMFMGCNQLVRGPKYLIESRYAQPGVTLEYRESYLGDLCCSQMFQGCTRLTTAPQILVDNLQSDACIQMFSGCTSLNYVKAMFITTPSSTYTHNWLDGVAATGTFVMNDFATWDSTITRGVSTVPSGWSINKEYADQYLTFEAIESGTFSFSLNNIQYSLDDGSTWTTLTAGSSTPTITAGNKIIWKASGLTATSSNYGGLGTFSATGNFNVFGNILSLVNGDNFNSVSSIARYQFGSMFRNNTKLVSAENLILPSFNNNDAYIFFMSGCSNLIKAPKISHITLVSECFARMFERTALTETPVFSNATSTAARCYMYMFNGCTSLTKVYPLVHTTLTTNCYCGMFIDCRILVNAPTLPATTLATGCYITMFQNCYALVKSPDLPATTLVTNCYQNMFLNCTSLNEVHASFTTEPSDTYTQNWLRNVSSTGTFYKSSSATWDQTITRGISTVPAGWTITNEL